MAGGFFKGVKEGIKDISDGTANQERKEKQEAKKQLNDKLSIENVRDEVDDLIGMNEEILYAYGFMLNKMVVTDKKLIFIDNKVAKNKTYAMIPFIKITSYSLLRPTGFSAKGKLMIFTGGDTPSLELESIFNEGMNEFCKILADRI